MLCVFFGFESISVVLKMSLSSFSILQFPGEYSEEQVMCASVCAWGQVFLIVHFRLSQNLNGGYAFLKMSFSTGLVNIQPSQCHCLHATSLDRKLSEGKANE